MTFFGHQTWRSRVEAKLDAIVNALAEEKKMSATLAEAVANLSTKVDAAAAKDAQVAADLQTLATEVATLKGQTTDPAQIAALDALAAKLDAATTALGTADAAAVPPAPPAPTA